MIGWARFGRVNSRREQSVGDKGGKKDKQKSQKQKAKKKDDEAKLKRKKNQKDIAV